MKFASILLISAALATIASAAPLAGIVDISTAPTASSLCSECTSLDQSALNAIVKALAEHYADIAQARLDDLMREVETAKVTSGSTELPKEKATLTITVQSRIDDAKKACASDALAPSILTAVTDDENLKIPWSQSDQVEKKMEDLNATIEKIILDRIEAYMNAERLSKDIAESMTHTVITSVPGTAAPVPEDPAPALAPETAALVPAVEPEASLASEQVPEQNDAVIDVNTTPQSDVDVAAIVGSRFVCSSGCKDIDDATTVLELREDLERQLEPRLQYLSSEEIPVACSESRSSLWDSVRNLLNNLSIEATVIPSK
ncbi:hypothetical protein BGZ68_003285 [Mortierella alpina]|nr:hypothetical protein BGZ68_003285 [Mortierella alpina]